jgi:hypothetical protein
MDSLDTDCLERNIPVFPESFQTHSEIVPQVNKLRFLSHIFQLIYHHINRCYAPLSLRESLNKS